MKFQACELFMTIFNQRISPLASNAYVVWWESGIYHRFHRQYVKTTDSDHNLPRCPNLLDRRFNDFGINEAWCGDITYLPTDEGWLYLASVIDLGTRRLVGYCFSKRMTTDIVMNALRMAYNNERPSEGCIFHSDQGSQYCSHAFQQELVEHAFRPSMSRLGQCWDNAPAEAFWATLKRECVPSNGSFKTRTEAMLQCTKWIRYYNLKRPHSTLGMKSPYKYWLDLMACRWGISIQNQNSVFLHPSSKTFMFVLVWLATYGYIYVLYLPCGRQKGRAVYSAKSN